MSALSGEQIVDSQHLLLDVFRDGYADRYVGDRQFLQSYLLPAQVAIVDNQADLLRGAALMRNSRITSIATRTDKEKYGSRFQGLVNLLESAHDVDNNAWISIGVGVKGAVRAAADTAGMSRARDQDVLESRLATSGKLDYYTLSSDGAGLLIKLAGSSHGPDYWQEVWDWNTNQSKLITAS